MLFNRTHKNLVIPAGLFVFSCLILCINLSSSTHLQSDENLYIQSCLEMLDSGEYLIPVFEGKTRFQKPVFYYWCVLGSYKLLGMNLFTARFPSVLAAALTTLIIYLFVKHIFSETLALPSALLVIANYFFFLFGRAAQTDATLTLFICLSLVSFCMGYFGVRNQKMWLFLSMSFAGIGFSVKGGVAVILSITPIIIFCLFNRDIKFLKQLFHPLNIVVFLTLSLWHYLYMYLHFEDQFFQHIMYREVSARLGWSSHQLVFRFARLFPGLLINSAPFSILPVLLLFLNRKCKPLPIDRFAEKNLFLIAIIVAIIGFFTIFVSRVTQRYILPVYPFFTVLTVVTYQRFILTERFRSKTVAILALLLWLMLLLAGYIAIILFRAELMTPWVMAVSVFLILVTGSCAFIWTRKPQIFPLVIFSSLLVMVFGTTIVRPQLQLEREKILMNGFNFNGKKVYYYKVSKGSRALINLQANQTFLKVNLDDLVFIVNRQSRRPHNNTWVILPKTQLDKFPSSLQAQLRMEKTAYRYSIDLFPHLWTTMMHPEKLQKLLDESRDWLCLVQVMPYQPRTRTGS